MVFLGVGFSEVRDAADIDPGLDRWRAEPGAYPSFLVVPGHGVLVAENETASALGMLEALGHVTARLAPADVGLIRYLTAEETAALTDAERARQKRAANAVPH